MPRGSTSDGGALSAGASGTGGHEVTLVPRPPMRHDQCVSTTTTGGAIVATTPGTPIAVDLRTPDVAAAREFYGPLFGWDFADGTACVLDGAVVATLHPGAVDMAGWWVSFAVESTTTFAQDAAAAGGTVLDQPSDPPTVRVADPTGATFVVVDGADHDALAPGVGRASWFEIMTGDAAAADRFYAAVFAYDIIAPEGGTAESAPFALLRSGDRTIGGRLALPPELEQALGARWMVRRRRRRRRRRGGSCRRAGRHGRGATPRRADGPCDGTRRPRWRRVHRDRAPLVVVRGYAMASASSPMVVLSPWPVCTMVSSDRTSKRSWIDARMVAWSE